MSPETSQRRTLMLCPICGRWMDAMCTEDRAIHDTHTQMCIGCTMKTSNVLDVQSMTLKTTLSFICFGFKTPTLEPCCRKRDGNKMGIFGESFRNEPLIGFSTNAGQIQFPFSSSVSKVPRAL